jgi:hypothetical protein
MTTPHGLAAELFWLVEHLTSPRCGSRGAALADLVEQLALLDAADLAAASGASGDQALVERDAAAVCATLAEANPAELAAWIAARLGPIGTYTRLHQLHVPAHV